MVVIFLRAVAVTEKAKRSHFQHLPRLESVLRDMKAVAW
jgi:hypothetical protein